MSEAGPFWRMADVTGNPVTVDIITTGAARVIVHDDNDQPTGSMLLTPEDAQRLADAVRRACSGEERCWACGWAMPLGELAEEPVGAWKCRDEEACDERPLDRD